MQRRTKLQIIIMTIAIMSAFLFPDIRMLTYIGRIGIVLYFIAQIFYNRYCNNRFYFLWVCTLSFVIILNLMFTVNFQETLDMSISMVTAVWAAFSLMEMMQSKDDLNWLCKCIIVCEFLFCIRLFSNINFATWGTRKVGTMMGMNVNSIGIRCVFAIVLCLYCIYKNKGGRGQFLYYTAFAVMLGAIFVTGSRRALLLSCISIAIFMIRNSNSPLKMLRTIALIVVGLWLIYYLITTIPELYSIIGARMQNFITGFMAGDSTAFDDGRDAMAKRAIELFWMRPIRGWGIGTFSEISGYNIAYCHNNYAELLYTTGVFGFLVFYSYIPKAISTKNSIKTHFHEYNLFLCIVIVLLLSDFAAVNCTTFFTQIFIGLLLTLYKIC